MKKHQRGSDNAVIKLRQKAEQQLKDKSQLNSLIVDEGDLKKLIHELQVHQIELEIQNEEYIKAKEIAEIAEEKYAELYNFAPSGYLTLAKDHEILELNFATAQLLNTERYLLYHRKFSNFLSTDETPVFIDFIDKVFASGVKQNCELSLLNQHKTTVYVVANGILNQNTEQCLLTLEDITNRKLTEIALIKINRKLEESESKFQQLVENIDECFWLRDNNKILYVSPGFETIWGLPCEALYNNPNLFFEKIHPDDIQGVQEQVNSVDFIMNSRFNYNYRILRADNDIRWINAKTFPVTDVNGNIFRRAGIAIDITDKIKEHFELELARKHAEESDRLKSAFLANMSHEIRTPMNGILGFSELLKNPGLSGEQQNEYIKIIEKSGARMLNIINDIIDISKIEAGLMHLDIAETNLNNQIEYVYTFFKPEVEAKGLRFNFQNTLSAKEAVIHTDTKKVYAVLVNLVKNAIKFTDQGSIEIGYHKKNDTLEIYVKDTGDGIPADKQMKIFERFVQADIEDKKAKQGAGLGLAISKVYIEMLGGKIWVESEPGKGSCFHFTLPYIVKKEQDLMKSKTTDDKSTIHCSNLKILIVEDDDTSKALLEIGTKQSAKTLFKATTGTDAVSICRKNPDIDLILMDIKLPEMNGYEAVKEIRKFNSNVIIIAQTSYGLHGDRELALRAGCNDYIAKPFKQSELIRLIDQYFNTK